MANLCNICHSAPPTETCALCRRMVCSKDYAGKGMCKECAKKKYAEKGDEKLNVHPTNASVWNVPHE